MARKRRDPPKTAILQEIGPDGWPIGALRPDRTLEERLVDDLRVCEGAWSAGNLVALLDAAAISFKQDRPFPLWAKVAIFEILLEKYRGGRKLGRHSTPARAQLENEKHNLRWDMVRDRHDRREELKALGYTPTLEAAFSDVAEALSEEGQRVSEESVRKSYYAVEKAITDATAARFYSSRFKCEKLNSGKKVR